MTTTLLDAITRLHAALDRLAVALAKGESDAVLAAEEPLASAVAELVRCPRTDTADIPGLPQAIAGVRAAVRRCESLGESAGDFVRAVFPEPAYERASLRLVADRSRRRTTPGR